MLSGWPITYPSVYDFTTIYKMAEEYSEIPAIEDTPSTHLSPSSVLSWKSQPTILSNPCRTMWSLVGNSYMGAGQVGTVLHTLVVLQVYQADVLKEIDEGSGLTHKAVVDLRRVTGLTL